MSYYKVLGLNADADVETIRKAASIRRVALEDTELFLNTLHLMVNRDTVKIITEDVCFRLEDLLSDMCPLICSTAKKAFFELREELVVSQSDMYNESNIQIFLDVIHKLQHEIAFEKKQIAKAYDTLVDDRKRTAYDNNLNQFFNTKRIVKNHIPQEIYPIIDIVMEYVGI